MDSMIDELASQFDPPDILDDHVVPTLDQALGFETMFEDGPPPAMMPPPPPQPQPAVLGLFSTSPVEATTPLTAEQHSLLSTIFNAGDKTSEFVEQKPKARRGKEPVVVCPPIEQSKERDLEIRKCMQYFTHARFRDRVSKSFALPSNLSELPLETIKQLNLSIVGSLCSGGEEELIKTIVVNTAEFAEQLAFPIIRTNCNNNPQVLRTIRRMDNIGKRMELAVDDELADPIALLAIEYTGFADCTPLTLLLRSFGDVCMDHYKRNSAVDNVVMSQAPQITVDAHALHSIN
jgi:hypothetical protein